MQENIENKIHIVNIPENTFVAENDLREEKAEHYGLEDIPQKYINCEPDFKTVSEKLKKYIKDTFIDADFVVRMISSSEHNYFNNTSLPPLDIARTIIENGSDRYNSNIQGDRYDNIEKKNIDFFALEKDEVFDDTFLYAFSTFYYYGYARSGEPRLVDIIIIYDSTYLNQVEYTQIGSMELKNDGFQFVNSNKADSIIGIVFITNSVI